MLDPQLIRNDLEKSIELYEKGINLKRGMINKREF